VTIEDRNSNQRQQPGQRRRQVQRRPVHDHLQVVHEVWGEIAGGKGGVNRRPGAVASRRRRSRAPLSDGACGL